MSKQSTSEPNKENEESKASVPVKKMCGIIMPIADTAGYDIGHWKDVLNILEDALDKTEFEAKLVSERLDIGLIHEEIVKNIYENEIVICDVSSKNPNVMFELGMRLAFDKPTIIIKDERTNYSFDIGGILHLEYPSSLRHNKIEKFKVDLCKHIEATFKKFTTEPNYSPFLKGFGRHIVAKTIEKSEISESQYIIEKLEDISKQLSTNKRKDNPTYEYKDIINNVIQSPGRTTRTTYVSKVVHFEEKEAVIKCIKENFNREDIRKVISGSILLIRSIIELVNGKFRIKLSEEDIQSLALEILENNLS